MGLDMYLTGKMYFGGKYNEKKRIIILKRKAKWDEKEDVTKIEVSDISGIEFEIGYWRKANAIHKWFVDNCFDGDYEEYNGREIYVSEDNLKALKDLCILVKNKLKSTRNVKEKSEIIENNLPMQDGFSFGFRDDEEGIKWYEEELDRTIKIVDKAFKKMKQYGLECFIYSASW